LIERGRYAGRVDLPYRRAGCRLSDPAANVIDILEVGVGGRLDRLARSDLQRLNVGPRSAGSMPVPACYGAAARRAGG